MILALRLISQLCQCLDDRGVVEAQSEKNGQPLYLRDGNDDKIDRKEYLLRLSTMISRRGSQTRLERLDTTDTKRNLNDTKNIFDQTASNPDDKDQSNKKGQNKQPNLIADLYSFPTEQEQLRGFDTSESRKKSDNTAENVDMYSPLKRTRNDQNNILRIEDNQEGDQVLDEIDLEKSDDEEGDDDLDPMHPDSTQHRKPKKELTLEQRVKKMKKRKPKKKKQVIEKGISPYRVNLPNDLSHLKQ